MHNIHVETSPASSGSATGNTKAHGADKSQAHTAGSFAQFFGSAHQSRQGLPIAEATGPSSAAKRQELAASLSDTASNAVLVAWPISAQFEVITPETASPDPTSLASFARSQGLDEASVQWLFQQDAGGIIQTATGQAQINIAAPTNPSSSFSAQDTLQPMTTSELLTTAGSPARAVLNTLTTSPPVLGAGVTSSAPTTLDLAQQMHLGSTSLTNSPLSSGSPLDNQAPAKGVVIANMGLQMAAQLSALQQSTTKSTPPATTGSEPSTQPSPLDSLIAGVTMRASSMKLQWQKATAETLRFTGKPAQPASITIDLTTEEAAWLEPEAMETNMTASRQENAPSQAGHVDHTQRRLQSSQGSNPPSEGPDISDSVDRTGKISELSQRMGEAIGQRLISAMERGQWQLKLMLRPAHLGHIEVDMRMRNGELDANFLASQAATRELLQEGLGRLKSTLNSLGMDVASMQIGDGQSRQFGENSTPHQHSPGAARTANKENAPVATAPIDAPKTSTGSDGLDVMV